MRDITTVIDQMLEVIPKNPSTSNIRMGLNSIRDRARNSGRYSAPESMSDLWYKGNDLFWKTFGGLDPVDLTGWERTVVDIWMDKKLQDNKE
jgi:hypothetical protein